jgi:inorganic pyrophosphatase
VLIINPVVIEKKKKDNTELAVNDAGEDTRLNQTGIDESRSLELTEKQLNKLKDANKSISNGANTFLAREFIYLSIFIGVFSLIIFFFCEEKQWTAYTTIAFLVGAGTSILSGWIGMKIATAANYRTTFSA